MTANDRRTPPSGSVPLDAPVVPVREPPRWRSRRGTRRGDGPEPGKTAKRALLWLAPTVLAIGFALYHWREPLAGWLFPVPPQVRLLEQAEAALAAGELTRPDGQGARELFSAVLALDPDHAGARAGLAGVGQAALAEARQALERDDRERARERLVLARSLGMAEEVLAPLAEELRHRDSVEDQLARLLERARAAEAEGRLDQGPDSALDLYLRMLEVAPDNRIAQAGRDGILERLAAEAVADLEEDRIEAAARAVRRIESAAPGFPGLPAVRAALSAALERRLGEVREALETGRLDQAEALLDGLADDPRVHAQREAIAAAWLDRAERHIEHDELDLAELALLQARRLHPDASPRLDRASTALERARRGRGPPPAEVTAEVAELLQRAERARAAGRLVSPPGDNAWDLLQRAYALAPGDLEVGRARLAVARAARECLETARVPADLERTGQCLAVVEDFDPADPELPALRRALASRWLGFSSERLGAGELARAERAWREAARIDPEHPDLPRLRARLDRARPGS